MSVVPRIILIGGPPATGKTTLAKELSSRLNLPWISTDQIRTMCNTTTKGNGELSEEIKNNEEIWKGVERLINSPFPWEGLIVEGVAILPHLVTSLDTKVSPVFIVDTNEKRIAETIYQRSLLPWIQTKTEEQRNKKVAFIIEFNNFIMDEARKYNFLVVEISKSNQDIKKVMELLE